MKRNSHQHLLPMVKFKLSRKTKNIGKLASATISLIAFQYLETLLMRLVINECDFLK